MPPIHVQAIGRSTGVRLSINRRMDASLTMPGYRPRPRGGRVMRFTLERLGEQAIVTGPEFKQLRIDLGEAIGRQLTAADMAKLCGLPQAGGADTIRRWEVTGPTGPVAKRLHI